MGSRLLQTPLPGVRVCWWAVPAERGKMAAGEWIGDEGLS